ncbi:MAG: hypothetical protein J6N21_10485, partial [Butyrivibrio sp.]|nr:hypothetical protein [Butyrivibrio sp.]
FLSTLVFYIMIYWLDMYVKHEKSYVPYILLSMLGIFAITIKLSATPMVLLSIVPIYKLWAGRTLEKTKAFWISVAMALVIVIPFLIRNVIISGWLLYPVTFLNLFGFDWKIPKGVAEFDALEIKTFGRGYNDVSAYGNLSFGQWIPHWFENVTGISRIMVILDIISIIVFVIYLGYFIYTVFMEKSGEGKSSERKKVLEISHRRSLRTADFLIVSGTAIGCLIFWFFSAPLIRYGVVYVWLVPAIVLGRMTILGFRNFDDKTKDLFIRVAAALFAFWMVYKMAFLVVDDAGRFNPVYLVKQQDYGSYEVKEFYLGNEKIYYPADGDQIGYYPFPAATNDLTGKVELRGESMKDGFITK